MFKEPLKHRGLEKRLEVSNARSCPEQSQLDPIAQDVVQSCLDTLKDGGFSAPVGHCAVSKQLHVDNLFLLCSWDFSLALVLLLQL